MSALLFDLQKVDVACEKRIVLRQVNLQIAAGEKIALVGPSGAGKTTLLNKLYQLRPSECAIIHQHYPLPPHLTVFQNICMQRPQHKSAILNLINRTIPSKKCIEEIRCILKAMEMEGSLFERTGQLTDSQQQAVAVGCAVYHSGTVLLADEPTAAAKPHRVDAVLKLITKTDKTVVMALHSVELPLKYAGRIVGLGNGRIHFDLPVGLVTPDHIADLYF